MDCSRVAAVGFVLFLSCSMDSVRASEQIEITCEILDEFYALWSESRYGEDPMLEKSAWIIRTSNGESELVEWPSTYRWKMEVWKGSIPENVIAQAHTHPVKTDPRPSTKDRMFSQYVNTPLYTVSRKGIWMVRPDGTTNKVAGSDWYIELYQNRCNGIRN